MDKPLYRLGFAASLLATIAILLFPVCFTLIAAQGPLYTWEGLEHFVDYAQTQGQFWQHLAYLAMLVFSLVFLVMLHLFYELSPPGRKFLARLAISFGLGFAILSVAHYFLQLTVVRFNLEAGTTGWIEPFLQANPLSFSIGLDMMGWSLFLGLASLFAAGALEGQSRLEKIIYWSLLLNGLFALLALVGYAWQILILLFLSINLAVGGALTVLSISTMILCWRKMR
jgi:hypothetical protein